MHSHPNQYGVPHRQQVRSPMLKEKDRLRVQGRRRAIHSGGTHLPENVTDKGMDLILIELKSRPSQVGEPGRSNLKTGRDVAVVLGGGAGASSRDWTRPSYRFGFTTGPCFAL